MCVCIASPAIKSLRLVSLLSQSESLRTSAADTIVYAELQPFDNLTVVVTPLGPSLFRANFRHSFLFSWMLHIVPFVRFVGQNLTDISEKLLQLCLSYYSACPQLFNPSTTSSVTTLPLPHLICLYCPQPFRSVKI